MMTGSLHRASSHSNLPTGPVPLGSSYFGRMASLGGAIGTSTDSVMEMQRVLTEEKQRSDQHRVNYQVLKSEHSKLQDAHIRLESELTNTADASRQTHERHRREISEYQRKLADLQGEIDSLRQNQVTSQRMEMIKLQVTDELEELYRERFARAQAEAEAFRTEFNKLRYENAFVKAEFEHQQGDLSRVVDELKMVHEAEVSNLRQEREQLLSRQSAVVSEETEKMKTLHRENAQLVARLKVASSALEEARAQQESAASQLDSGNRVLAKQLSESQSACRHLEAEKDSLKDQIDLLTRELASIRNELSQTHTRCLEQEKMNSSLQHRLDDMGHKTRLDIAQLRLDTTKQKGEIERQRDTLAGKIEDLEHQLELAAAKCGQMEAIVAEREASLVRREAGLREEEWTRIQAIENEKTDLEHQLAEMGRKMRDVELVVAEKEQKAADKLKQAEASQRSIDSERENLKRRAETGEADARKWKSEAQNHADQLEKSEAELQECYARLTDLEVVVKEHAQMSDEIGQLRHRLEEMRRSGDRAALDREAQWRSEREALLGRVGELEEELRTTHTKLRQILEENRKKKKKYGRYFTRQKQRLQLTEARLEELQTENEILKRNVPHEEHAKLKRQLKDLQRRHQEYRNIILQQPVATTVAPVGGAQSLITDEERQHQEELRLLRDRIDDLAQRQREQDAEMSALKVASNVSGTGSQQYDSDVGPPTPVLRVASADGDNRS